MTQLIAAHFDGKVIIPDEPVQLPVGKQLHIRVKITQKKIAVKEKKNRKIVGLGRFPSGIKDLGSNKNHLKEFGK